MTFPPFIFSVFLSGHRLGKETVGLNGAKALFLSISDGDIVRLPGNSSDFVFILFFILSHSPVFCHPLFEAAHKLFQSFQELFLFVLFWYFSGYSFGCVSDISLGTCVFICI